MVIRDGEAPLEVLMLRRSLESEFVRVDGDLWIGRSRESELVRGAYVLPGGAVDSTGGDPEMLAYCTGRSDAQASAVLELDSRSEEHTSELQSLRHLVCRLLLEK